ncbi:sigma-70 family RNA polymerase sigma factor [Lachnospiraceae bacterium 47-T17]
MEEEQELIQKAKAHEAAAFSMLMQRHGSSLYKVAKAILKSDEDVADAMQETALSCWEKIDTLQSEQYFKTWLIRILINHCNTIRRKKSRYVLGTLLPEKGAEENAYTNAEWMELLQCLNEKHRIAVVLYYVEGLRIREIAGLLHISESAVKERLARARKTVAKQLHIPADAPQQGDFHSRIPRSSEGI